MQHRIEGVVAQTLHVSQSAGEGLWASNGAMLALDDGIDWRLRVPGGVEGAVRRSLSGERLSLTYMEWRRDGAEAVFGASRPGKIATWDLADGPVLATRGAFLAAVGDVQITATVARRVDAAFFGGAGLFLQKVTGRGVVFVHGSGDFLDRWLEAGETLLVSTGNLAAFSESVDYRIRGVGGCRKVVFGREGLFMTELSGPGRVLLQSLSRRRTSQAGQH